MTHFAEHVASDLRLRILQLLAQDIDYAVNEYILARALESVGHAVSRDHLRVQLDWLAEQGLITVENVSGVTVAKLTVRGKDIAEGRARVSGVHRPDPED